MPVDLAPFLHMPLKLMHHNSLLMLQSQRTIHLAYHLPPDPDPSSHFPVMVTFTQTAVRTLVISISAEEAYNTFS
eukprot:4420458-Ditylum_brightwellii.AAC.1